MKKDIRVEFLRIIGAIIVIGVHLSLPMSQGEGLDMGRALIAAFFADGVAIFWFISGFFMYEKYSYKHTLKRTFKTVVLPLLGFNAFLFFFGEHNLGWKDVARSILQWENPFGGHVQLWYLYIYILLMLCTPVIYAFIHYLREVENREKWFMILSFTFLVINDLSNNTLAVFSHHTINALVPAVIITIWGNIIYRKCKDIHFERKHAGIAMAGFVLCNLLRWGIQILRSAKGVEGIHIYFWFSALALVNVCCLVVFVFALLQNKKKNKKWARVINGLASYTFMIYMLHMLVYHIVQKMVDMDVAYQALCNVLPTGEGFLSEVIYVLVIVPIIFALSLGFGILLRNVKKIIGKLAKNIKGL